MVYVLRVKVAETPLLPFITTTQLDPDDPEYPPDQPAKVEFASGAAVSVTAVPALNVVPVGLVVTVPEPVPPLVTVSV